MLSVGIDVGSSAVKAVLMKEQEGQRAEILSKSMERLRKRDTAEVVDSVFDYLLSQADIRKDQLDYIATTGEGENVAFRTGHFYGMTTHARGGQYIDPEARAVLDIGALHTRAVLMDELSKVLGYRMTSQCASGSGQFLENISRYLGVTLEEIGPLSLQSEDPEACSSICAVLAETDVINMVSRGIKTTDILKGIHVSMAGRYARLLAAAGAKSVALVTGGLAADVGMVAAVQEAVDKNKKTNVEIRSHELSIYAGAIGAALWGAFRARKLAIMGVAFGGQE